MGSDGEVRDWDLMAKLEDESKEIHSKVNMTACSIFLSYYSVPIVTSPAVSDCWDDLHYYHVLDRILCNYILKRYIPETI